MRFAADHKGLYILSIILATIGVACSLAPYYAVSEIIIGLIAGTKDISFIWVGVLLQRCFFSAGRFFI